MGLLGKITSIFSNNVKPHNDQKKAFSPDEEAPIVVAEDLSQIKGPKPKKVIVVAPVINEPTKLPIKRKTQETVAHYPTKADLYGNIPLNDSNYSKYRRATLMLPEFDFYTGRNCDIYNENSQEARIIRELKQWAAEKLGEAKALEDIQEYEKAAAIYEEMVHHRYWENEPYRRLLHIYKKAGLVREYASLVQMTNAHFRKISQEQERYLLNLADRYKCRAYAKKIITEGKDLSYYDGLFFIYRASLAMDHDGNAKA